MMKQRSPAVALHLVHHHLPAGAECPGPHRQDQQDGCPHRRRPQLCGHKLSGQDHQGCHLDNVNIINIILTKVWDLDSISSPVHSIDRHELGIEDILVSRVEGEVLTRCRNCVLVWDINTGKVYLSCLNDQALNASFNSESYLKLMDVQCRSREKLRSQCWEQ